MVVVFEVPNTRPLPEDPTSKEAGVTKSTHPLIDTAPVKELFPLEVSSGCSVAGETSVAPDVTVKVLAPVRTAVIFPPDILVFAPIVKPLPMDTVPPLTFNPPEKVLLMASKSKVPAEQLTEPVAVMEPVIVQVLLPVL